MSGSEKLTWAWAQDAPRGRGLHRFPLSALEQELVQERRRQLREARKAASVEVRDGRRFKVLRLPDDFEQAEPVRTVEPRRHMSKRGLEVLG